MKQMKSAIAVAISLAGVLALAQTPAPPAGQPSNTAGAPAAAKPAAPKPVVRKPPSQVDSVIQLAKAGMSEAFIVKYLQKTNKPADLTPTDMVKLKEAGVSETVIGVMMDPSSAPAPAPAPVPEAAPTPAPVVAAPPPPPPPELQGDWRGTLVTPKVRIPLAFHFTSGGAGTVDSPSQKKLGTPVQYSINGGQATISIPSVGATYTAPADPNQMAGTFSQQGTNLPLTLVLNGPAEEVPAPKAVAAGDWKGAISAALEDKYPLTGAAADGGDIVTPGAVLQLRKSGLVMFRTGMLVSANTFKGGAITQGFFGTLAKTNKDGTARTFVRGEKFWMTGIEVKDDGVTLKFLSDPLPESRYEGALKFPFAKGTQPTPDQILPLVSEVIAVVAPPPAAAAAPAQQQMAPITPPPPPPDPAMAPIAPPPPPPATLAVGQTKDQVIAAMGQPDKMANLGPKQILYYKSLKVTLVGGKVSAIE